MLDSTSIINLLFIRVAIGTMVDILLLFGPIHNLDQFCGNVLPNDEMNHIQLKLVS
jgi:hypothetical protein